MMFFENIYGHVKNSDQAEELLSILCRGDNDRALIISGTVALG